MEFTVHHVQRETIFARPFPYCRELAAICFQLPLLNNDGKYEYQFNQICKFVVRILFLSHHSASFHVLVGRWGRGERGKGEGGEANIQTIIIVCFP